ncbi:MAG: transaldolase, partial [Nitrososphaeria archaeon]|nr:transaldolase [Nitrososphaeria archaeon]NIQ34273.1 transaldolase [Nitrososphaeria archaeon]
MIFLDSSDVHEIIDWKNAGVIRGVTTNPTILKKDGVSKKDIKSTMLEICKVVFPYPVSIEITTQGFYASMLVEAKETFAWAPNVVIKVPIHGPDGETNLPLINELSNARVRVNVTACMNAQQLFLANQAGAAYVSLFGGRVADMGHDVESEIKKY